LKPFPGLLERAIISRSGSGNGRGLRRTALTTLKIAVVAPIPSASATTATTAKPGLLASVRMP
jgi:hypothetical protein